MIGLLENCRLCARNCGVNRLRGERGFCRAGQAVRVARASLHRWEEPCVSGERGSGTVFFSHCSLRCVFCQNHPASQGGVGKDISGERLARIFLDLAEKGAHNINLVTPAHFVPQIIPALEEARQKGLDIPVVYNTSGYETVETVRLLKGLVDVYLPDLKYFDDRYAVRYSGAPGYFPSASRAIEEMVSQAGRPRFDRNGLIHKGVIVRHLMIPGLLFDSKKVIDYIHGEFGDSVYISLMNQYTPMHNAGKYSEINRALSPGHYEGLVRYCLEIGVTNAFIQEEGTASEDYVPPFNLLGV